MNFWIFAVVLLAIPAAVISWPLFAGSPRERMTGMLMLLAMPLVGLFLYQQIGSPEAVNQATVSAHQQGADQQAHATEQTSMNAMIAGLQQRMAENPDDPEGWLMLGRSLKTMQRYAEAETALTNANRLMPDNALIMVELAEASLFTSGKAEISPQVLQLIEDALVIDPLQQKGLWLLGMAAAQSGDEARAITVWQTLLNQLDPASGAAVTVTQQIELAQARLGQPVAGLDFPVTITLADDLAGAVPANAVLFVFIHPAGATGMPLAVKRIAAQNFPISVHFNDADLLRPDMTLNDHAQLDISARISMTGTANAAPGDLQASPVTVDTEAQAETLAEIALHLDQRVP